MPFPVRNFGAQCFIAVIGCLLALFMGQGLVSQEKKTGKATEKEAAETDAADKDYSAELPRIPATAAKDAVKTFTVAKGFQMDLVAAEPQVTDPIALAID